MAFWMGAVPFVPHFVVTEEWLVQTLLLPTQRRIRCTGHAYGMVQIGEEGKRGQPTFWPSYRTNRLETNDDGSPKPTETSDFESNHGY